MEVQEEGEVIIIKKQKDIKCVKIT
jgi:hypothetical protein